MLGDAGWLLEEEFGLGLKGKSDPEHGRAEDEHIRD